MRVLFEVEQDHVDHQILRISGRASVWTDQEVQRPNTLQALRKHILTPGALLNSVTHVRLFQAMHNYHTQSAEKGLACVIEVTPEQRPARLNMLHSCSTAPGPVLFSALSSLICKPALLGGTNRWNGASDSGERSPTM